MLFIDKGDHLELKEPSSLRGLSVTANTPLPTLEVVMMYKDHLDGQMKDCTSDTCGNDAEVNIDVTVPRELNGTCRVGISYLCLVQLCNGVVGQVLKTFNPKNQKLLSSNVTLGGEGVAFQVWSGDLAARKKASNVSWCLKSVGGSRHGQDV